MGMYRIPKRAELVKQAVATIPEGPKEGIKARFELFRIPGGYSDGDTLIFALSTDDLDDNYARSWRYSGKRRNKAIEDYNGNVENMRKSGWSGFDETTFGELT